MSCIYADYKMDFYKILKRRYLNNKKKKSSDLNGSLISIPGKFRKFILGSRSLILLLKEWKVIVKGDLQQPDVIWHSDWNDCNFSSQVAWKNVFNFSSEMTSQVFRKISHRLFLTSFCAKKWNFFSRYQVALKGWNYSNSNQKRKLY